MSKERIIFMGTPDIASIYLNSLIDLKYNIVAIYSQPPRKKGRGMKIQESPVHKMAVKNSIKIFTPTNLNNEKLKKEFQILKPDIVIVMGYGLKLPNYLINFPKFGCINIHVSLLPRWRGAAPIEHAILNGDKETGISIFKIVEKMDAGPIIVQDSVKIDENINKAELTSILNFSGIRLLQNVLPKIFSFKIKYENQDPKKVTYARKISSDMRKIDFNENIHSIQNKIRAFSPNPGAWFVYKNERIKIIKSSYIKGRWESSIILNSQFHIGCKLGKICPEVIQKEGKKEMDLDNFLRGFEFNIGDKVNE